MITTDIYWPSELPFPLWDDNTMEPVQTFRRTRLASGRERQRRLYTSVPTNGSISWIMTQGEQATAFEAWFRDVLLDGQQWFNAPRRTPLGMMWQITRFASMPVPSPLSPTRWRYASSVETWGRPVDAVPRGWGAFPEYLKGSNILDVALNHNWPAA